MPYFDLSLQHVSRPLLSRMRRWGDRARFLDRIATIRAIAPDAALRSSFILGYPGETEEDQDRLLEFLAEAQLDWAGFFTFSEEEGTHAQKLPGKVAGELALERLRECSETQDAITAAKRAGLVQERISVLVDEPGRSRSHREAPEIDGIVHVPEDLPVGRICEMTVTGAAGPDLWAERIPATAGQEQSGDRDRQRALAIRSGPLRSGSPAASPPRECSVARSHPRGAAQARAHLAVRSFGVDHTCKHHHRRRVS